MKTIQVADATTIQLDWLITRLEGYLAYGAKEHTAALAFAANHRMGLKNWCTQQQLMGPIIDREFISTSPGDWNEADLPVVKNWTAWSLSAEIHGDEPFCYGDTRMVAAARCYITSKLGVTAEVPEVLG